MAWSGNCVISNYTEGRDSNRGGCSHACRFQYKTEGFEGNTAASQIGSFLSSKDLFSLSLLPQFIAAGINCLKIDGRMKSNLYVATLTKYYRLARDAFLRDPTTDFTSMENEIRKIPHRDETSASLIEKAGEKSVYRNSQSNTSPDSPYIGTVLQVFPDNHVALHVKNSFTSGTALEALTFEGTNISLDTSVIKDIEGFCLEKASPNSVVLLHSKNVLTPFNLIRKKQKS
jgi:putative protease